MMSERAIAPHFGAIISGNDAIPIVYRAIKAWKWQTTQKIP
jgi:hypothetical protein